jgi:hypothetical protein
MVICHYSNFIKLLLIIGVLYIYIFFFFFFDMSTQEEGEGFELVTSASLGMVPTD